MSEHDTYFADTTYPDTRTVALDPHDGTPGDPPQDPLRDADEQTAAEAFGSYLDETAILDFRPAHYLALDPNTLISWPPAQNAQHELGDVPAVEAFGFNAVGGAFESYFDGTGAVEHDCSHGLASNPDTRITTFDPNAWNPWLAPQCSPHEMGDVPAASACGNDVFGDTATMNAGFGHHPLRNLDNDHVASDIKDRGIRGWGSDSIAPQNDFCQANATEAFLRDVFGDAATMTVDTAHHLPQHYENAGYTSGYQQEFGGATATGALLNDMFGHAATMTRGADQPLHQDSNADAAASYQPRSVTNDEPGREDTFGTPSSPAFGDTEDVSLAASPTLTNEAPSSPSLEDEVNVSRAASPISTAMTVVEPASGVDVIAEKFLRQMLEYAVAPRRAGVSPWNDVEIESATRISNSLNLKLCQSVKHGTTLNFAPVFVPFLSKVAHKIRSEASWINLRCQSKWSPGSDADLQWVSRHRLLTYTSALRDAASKPKASALALSGSQQDTLWRDEKDNAQDFLHRMLAYAAGSSGKGSGNWTKNQIRSAVTILTTMESGQRGSLEQLALSDHAQHVATFLERVVGTLDRKQAYARLFLSPGPKNHFAGFKGIRHQLLAYTTTLRDAARGVNVSALRLSGIMPHTESMSAISADEWSATTTITKPSKSMGSATDSLQPKPGSQNDDDHLPGQGEATDKVFKFQSPDEFGRANIAEGFLRQVLEYASASQLRCKRPLPFTEEQGESAVRISTIIKSGQWESMEQLTASAYASDMVTFLTGVVEKIKNRGSYRRLFENPTPRRYLGTFESIIDKHRLLAYTVALRNAASNQIALTRRDLGDVPATDFPTGSAHGLEPSAWGVTEPARSTSTEYASQLNNAQGHENSSDASGRSSAADDPAFDPALFHSEDFRN